MSGLCVEVEYERTGPGLHVQLHTLYPDTVNMHSNWIMEVWHGYKRLRPCERAGMERWYEVQAVKGDSIAVDCYSMPRYEFGPRARIDVLAASLEVSFSLDMDVSIESVVTQLALSS